MHCITSDMIVSIRYRMYNSRDELVEDTMCATPVQYLHGSAGIARTLQSQLEELTVGDHQQIWLRKDLDQSDDDYRFEVIVDGIRPATPAEVNLGYPVSATADTCGDDCSCYH